MFIRFALLWLLSTGIYGTSQADELTVGLGSYDYPPFYYQQDDQLTGAAIDIAEALAQQLGHTLKYQRMPFARVQRELASGGLDMVVLFFRTPEREQYAVYVDEPHLAEASYLLIKKEQQDLPTTFNGDFNDWSESVFISVRGYFHGDGYAEADFLRKVEVNNEQELLQRLTGDRPFVGLGNKATLLYHAKALGLTDRFRFIEPAVDVGYDHMAFSRQHPKAESLAQAFNQALKAYKKTPQYQQILRRYQVSSGVSR